MGVFDGRVVIVTGAARGLGRDYAKYFARDGANVVLADVKDTEAAAADVAGAGPKCMGVETDVTDRGSVEGLMRQTQEQFGRLDVLVNNAGLWRGMNETGLLHCPDDVWERAFLEKPLNMIRLVDNMDMRQTRLTPTQNEPAFREVYTRLGDHQEMSRLSIQLESLENQTKRDRKTIEEETNRVTTEFLATPSTDSLERQVKEALQRTSPDARANPKAMRTLLNRALLDAIFQQAEMQALPQKTKEDVRFIGMQQSSYDFRHFGGTEAVTDVQLKAIPHLDPEKGSIPCVVITVNRGHFEKLNHVQVSEEGINVGIGEYQIWRASDAYKSIQLGNTKVHLQVVDEKGTSVECIVSKG